MSLMLQNFILFQAGWLACVIGGASSDYFWVGIAVVAVIIVVHLSRASDIRNETTLIVITMVLGTAWDSVLVLSGLFTFMNGTIFTGMVPFWLIAMWALFATTLNVSMKWLKHKYLLAAVFGAVGGPVAYFAGHRIGAVDFSDTSTVLLAVGAGWSIIMPALMALATRFNGYENIHASGYEVKTA